MNEGDRVLSRVFPEPMSGCWLWGGYVRRDGYGQTRFRGRVAGAHRAVYVLLVGEIPEGLVIDHLCRNRSCVNPDHVELVDPGENSRRGMMPNMVTMRTGVCKRGHQIEGTRHCRPCRLQAQKDWNKRQKAVVDGAS